MSACLNWPVFSSTVVRKAVIIHSSVSPCPITITISLDFYLAAYPIAHIHTLLSSFPFLYIKRLLHELCELFFFCCCLLLFFYSSFLFFWAAFLTLLDFLQLLDYFDYLLFIPPFPSRLFNFRDSTLFLYLYFICWVGPISISSPSGHLTHTTKHGCSMSMLHIPCQSVHP
jgi:hypothetical protein